jgi:hypothetical protein
MTESKASDVVLPTSRGRRWAIRAVLMVCLALTAWHIFATFLWVAPVTPLRQIVPGRVLTQYMLPLYGQSWSVFAPDPINGNYTLKVRASWARQGSSEVVTGWVNATASELALSRDNPFPPRAANAAVQQASQFLDAYGTLNADSKNTVAKGYFEGSDWRKRLEDALTPAADGSSVNSYLSQEYYTDAYATQVAKAVWGSKVQQVQFEVSRTNIPDFDERNAGGPPQPIQLANIGWRPPVEMPGQSDEHFAEIFNQARAKASNEN